VRRCLLNACRVIVTAALAVALPAAALAQAAYRYRDANGQWVFGDRAASAAAPAGDAISLTHEHEALRVSVERADTDATTQLIGVNECLCVVTLRVSIEQSDFAQISRGHAYQASLEPGARQVLVSAPHLRGESRLRYSWTFALGSPKAVHSPASPYRAPFAVGETFTVTQAYPTRITHVTPDSAYAIDFALPDGTPVYAAREGTVINVRHDSFRGAPLPAMLDQANLIEILHDDGTIGVYGHLHWDSIRVHIGQRVARGEYIANSGNTGFSTGPHLHFAVWRNAGTTDISIPVQFAGIGGVPVTAATSVPLTAY
jgi:murein DD-endopeptidase MepM/ murein hydrolase activator NlpD